MPDRANSEAPARGRRWAWVAAFVRMPIAEKLMLPLAWLLLALCSIAVGLLPFRLIAPVLGKQVGTDHPPAALDPVHAARAQRIRNAVNRSARVMPLRSDCLPQAFAATLLSRLLAIPSTAHIGVRQDSAAGGMAAHAWVLCGDFWLSGGESTPDYAPIAGYRRPHR